MITESSIYNLGQLFNQIALKFKDKIALKYPDNSFFSFKELNILSNKIANYLIEIGVKKNDVVIILNNQSNEGYALMIACLKIGAIYSNIDPKSPIDRFKKMVDVCNPKTIFYFQEQKLIHPKSKFDKKKIITINYEDQLFIDELRTISVFEPLCVEEVKDNNPAYIMFTSGSTGFA